MTDVIEKKAEGESALDRREFFRLTGLGVGATAAVAIGVAPKAEAGSETGLQGQGGYRETDHVRRYYQLARF